MLVVVCAGPAVLIILSLAVVVGLLILSVGIACLNRLYPSLSLPLSLHGILFLSVTIIIIIIIIFLYPR